MKAIKIGLRFINRENNNTIEITNINISYDTFRCEYVPTIDTINQDGISATILLSTFTNWFNEELQGE